MIAKTISYLILILTQIGLSQAHASTCPDLSGTYKSEYNGSEFTANVETLKDSTGKTFYIFTASGERIEIYADGKLHDQKTTRDFPHLKNRKYSAHCRDNKLLYWETAQILDQKGRVIGQHYQLTERFVDHLKMTVNFIDMRDVFKDGSVDSYPSFSHSSERISE